MRHYHLLRNPAWRPIVNVEKLWTLVPKEELEKCQGNKDLVPVVDTLQAGFGKVLGKGAISHPFIVKARFVSELAEKKIKEAGGVVSLVA